MQIASLVRSKLMGKTWEGMLLKTGAYCISHILVGDRIKNPVNDDVWQFCLKLREIVDLICEPKIHKNQVAYIVIHIQDYIQLRNAKFPQETLKVKHRDLVYYQELIL